MIRFDHGHRLPEYREFRRHLMVPLVTVDLTFHGESHLEAEDADILIRLQGGSTLWQKERLLNLALRALPPHVKAVTWLDCDLVFFRKDWPEELLEKLQRFEMVQSFRRFYYQNRGESLEEIPHHPDRAFESAAFRFTEASLPEQSYQMPEMSRSLRYVPGGACAARRSLLDRNGFYDTAVLGGGDKLMFSAAAGRYDPIGKWMCPWNSHKPDMQAFVREQLSMLLPQSVHQRAAAAGGNHG